MIRILLISMIFIQQFALNGQIKADYSNDEHWLILPKDNQNILTPYITDSSLISYAEVFYIYRTVVTDKRKKNLNGSIIHEEQ